MNILKKCTYFIKENWKAMIFAVIYLIFAVWSIALISEIDNYFSKGNPDNISSVLLFVAGISAFSLIMRFISKLIFKDKCIEMLKKSSRWLIFLEIILGIMCVSGFIFEVPISFDDSSELSKVVSLFLVPGYFILIFF